jgi:hypothetical protein
MYSLDLILYLGSLKQFREFMERLARENRPWGGWVAPTTGKKLAWGGNENLSGAGHFWHVFFADGPKGGAAVEANEIQGGLTMVQFTDGCFPTSRLPLPDEPIGATFHAFRAMIKERIAKSVERSGRLTGVGRKLQETPMKDSKYCYHRPGTVENFRVMMLRLSNQFSAGWEASTGEILHFWDYDIPRRSENDQLGTWLVLYGEGTCRKGATIKAYAEFPDEITVTFQDGLHPETGPGPAIGSPADEFREMVVREARLGLMGMNTEPTLGWNADTEGGIPLPKKESARQRWKEAYKIMLEVDGEWEEEYFDDWERDRKVPTVDDYRERLQSLYGGFPSAKTVMRIRRAGEAGLLT